MKITKYAISTNKIKTPIKIACVSDLHGRRSKRIIPAIKKMSPDLILLAGDIFEVANKSMEKRNANSFAFLREALKISPVYYCYGNHEIYYSHDPKKINRLSDKKMAEEYTSKIIDMGTHLINDSYDKATVNGQEIIVGGLVCGYDKHPDITEEFNSAFLDRYAHLEGFKILLCHYPHYYDKHLKDTDFDLILSGHAHGGQWRIFNRGVFAPHQGLFPEYTRGIYDGRFIISTGAVNNSKPIPRFFNPTEILEIQINNSEEML